MKVLSLMLPTLNQNIPFDVIVRWWYVLAAGSAIGLIFSRVTDIKPLHPLPKVYFIVEGPPSRIESAKLAVEQGWKDDLLFTFLGFLLACGVVWLLEEIRTNHQGIRHP